MMDTAPPLQVTPVVLRRNAKTWSQTRSYSPSRRRGIVELTGSISSDETAGSEVTNMSETTRGTNVEALTEEVARIRPRSNIGNIEIKHEDTDSEMERKVNTSKVEDEGQSTGSEGWRFERRQKVVRSLQFKDSPKLKARTMSVQELVEGAENLLRRPRRPIESRDASGESTSESDSCESPPTTPAPARPLSLSCFSELLPQSGSRQWSASETSLNNISTVKKRRLRPKRKFGSLKKMDGAALSPAGGSDRPSSWIGDCPPALVKSESFSGMGRGDRSSPTQSPVKCSMAADSAVSSERRGSSESSSSPSESLTLQRGEESEEECRVSAAPALSFKLGPHAGVVTASATESEKLGGEEPSSLNTEDCWDDYQEKYPSEQYSEEAEDDKHLLNFGDDYRKFLDSPSDTSRGPRRRRLRQYRPSALDSTESESEPEELRSILERSMSQLRDVESLLHAIGLSVNYDELLRNCQENIKCLRIYLDAVSANKFMMTKSNQKIKDVLDQWVLVQGKLEGRSSQVRLQLEQKMEMLRGELCLLAADADSEKPRLENREELAKKIARVKSDLEAIRDRKALLLQLNTTVHHYASVLADHSHALKQEVVDLYHLWQDTFDSVSSQLCDLQRAEQDWLELEDQLKMLMNALRADRDTLGMIDSALHSDDSAVDLPDSARDLAKVLCERDPNAKCGLMLDDPCLLLTEGSLSDSGISDSGSELELFEREKRLTSLKLLARQLEAILDPGSQALRNMAQRIEEAEMELRVLQRTCRELISKSAASNEAVKVSARVTGKRRKSQVTASNDPDDDPIGGSPWFWRVIRSALPFQLALVALLCVACLLEPQCCDAMNNLGLSHTSQFRYFSGPPPV